MPYPQGGWQGAPLGARLLPSAPLLPHLRCRFAPQRWRKKRGPCVARSSRPVRPTVGAHHPTDEFAVEGLVEVQEHEVVALARGVDLAFLVARVVEPTGAERGGVLVTWQLGHAPSLHRPADRLPGETRTGAAESL